MEMFRANPIKIVRANWTKYKLTCCENLKKNSTRCVFLVNWLGFQFQTMLQEQKEEVRYVFDLA